MSSTFKIITAILIAAVMIAGAVFWTNRDTEDAQISDTSTEAGTDSNTLPVPPPTPSINPEPSAMTPPPAVVSPSFEESVPATNWVLWRVTLDNKTADLNINVPAPLTLQFDTKAKKITGFAGCNTFSGSYATGANNALSFGALVSTKKGCPQTSALENTITTAMSKVTNYGIKGNQLVLSNDNSSTEIVYDQAK